ncbi:MAG: hypothetical protein LBV40_04630 [Methanomicrobiales archaeon]|jgi:hypothetical protein|nr:hypothetical protein [Methanomicrobiales archaeon]
MKTKKTISQILLILFLAVLTPHAVSAEITNEAFTTGTTAAELDLQAGISGLTGGQMIYSSALSSRIIPENPSVPLETHYSVDIASADPQRPISAIVSTVFAAKSVSVMPNNSSTLTSTDIEDKTKVAGQISKILKEFDYIVYPIS